MWFEEAGSDLGPEETEEASIQEGDEADDQTEPEVGHVEWAGYI